MRVAAGPPPRASAKPSIAAVASLKAAPGGSEVPADPGGLLHRSPIFSWAGRNHTRQSPPQRPLLRLSAGVHGLVGYYSRYVTVCSGCEVDRVILSLHAYTSSPQLVMLVVYAHCTVHHAWYGDICFLLTKKRLNGKLSQSNFFLSNSQPTYETIDKLYSHNGKVFRLPWELNLLLPCSGISALYTRINWNSWPSLPVWHP